MYILGISSYYHDSSACLISKGEIIAAAQEERFTRRKHDERFPFNSIKYCLKEANIDGKDINKVVFYEKPFIKFERLIETYLATAPFGFISFAKAIPLWIKDKLFQKHILIKELNKVLDNKIEWKKRLLFSDHHLSHAASAFYPSPFQNSAILTIDGVGEWTTTSLAIGRSNEIKSVKEIHFPHSLGLLYSAFTYYIGFKVNSGEYKVMGLAPYGKPIYAELIKKNLIKVADDGSFQLNMKYFDYLSGLKMTNKKFHKLFNGLPRKSESQITQREMDLAASIQKVTEEIIIKLARNILKETGERNLCLAGGVALNCVVNGILLQKNIFDKIWIQPASGDAGGSIGAALAVWYSDKRNKRITSSNKDFMKGSYLGPEFTNDEIEFELKSSGGVYKKLKEDELIEYVANCIAHEKAVGWMQGRMEFGPRALGNRSIIADPRSPIMQKQLNLKVKFRESFRPFAPSVLSEDLQNWFEIDTISPYMLLVANIQKDKRLPMTDDEKKLFGIEKLNVPRSLVPAVTHVDYSARIQTVHSDTNFRYYSVIRKFKEKTGCPIVVNTSFNVRGEPIVCSPTDAFRCFMGTKLDILVIGNYILIKEEQNKKLIRDYKGLYELD